MNELIRFIPDYHPKRVVNVLSQVVDWGSQFTNINKYREITKTKGENVKVVVLDTGANAEHPDLSENFKGCQNFTDEADANDMIGHSSAVLGIIGAIDNEVGVIGVAPKCDLYAGKVLNNQGLCPPDYQWIINGLQWAIDINADVVNMSLGSPFAPPDKFQKLVKAATSKGMILVAASGNEQLQTIDYPGRYNEVISVAAMDKNGNLATYSNIGQGLDFIAPGSDVYSTYINNGYATISGTSFSSPFIAGVVALLLSYHRNGLPHKSPICNYQDAIDHIKKFEKGRLIDLGDGKGIGILDFNQKIEDDIVKNMLFENKINMANHFSLKKLYIYKLIASFFKKILIKEK